MKAGHGSSSGPRTKMQSQQLYNSLKPFYRSFFSVCRIEGCPSVGGGRISGSGLKRASGAWCQSAVFAKLGKEFRLFSSRIWNNWLSTLFRNWAKKWLQNLWKTADSQSDIFFLFNPAGPYAVTHHPSPSRQEAKGGGGELDKKRVLEERKRGNFGGNGPTQSKKCKEEGRPLDPVPTSERNLENWSGHELPRFVRRLSHARVVTPKKNQKMHFLKCLHFSQYPWVV